MRYRNGDKFTGKFEKNHLKEGEMLYSSLNESYIGQWKNSIIDGQGVYRFSNGEIYDGRWKDGLMHGSGLYSYPDGSEFFGTFEDGIKTHGK